MTTENPDKKFSVQKSVKAVHTDIPV